ncbi:MAG: hypothetical protein A3F74_18535 [Betaproteobacteria bacterium RIFCSPLOWO2_12_FULL_62_58]|nr:MAG: hypothetical protein A3F74_18535 [Betaproteobacteria bacterium RIFCSPLOWO2_12_FULL_62_58]
MCRVGGSDSGKTTPLRQMLGLERPARGEVLIFGESLHRSDPGNLRKLRDRRGVLFQEGVLFSALTVSTTSRCRFAICARSTKG